MGFGFSKDFVLFLVISIIISIVFNNWQSGVGVLLFYIICKVIWNVLT